MKNTLIILLTFGLTLALNAEPYRLHTTSDGFYHSAATGTDAPATLGTTSSPALIGEAPTATGSVSTSAHISGFGSSSLPQTEVYTPFTDYQPQLRLAGGPGDGHSGGTDIERPDLPIGSGLLILLILSMLTIIIRICTRSSYSQH